jgi:hypothetical protein
MTKGVKQTLALIGGGILLLLLIIVFNQLHQIFLTTSAINPTLGQVVTVLLGLIFAVIFLIPVFGYIKLRKPLETPDENDELAYNNYLRNLKSRLYRNKYIKEKEYEFDESKPLVEQIEGALDILNKETFSIMRETSSTVFITTAVSQNGVLDSLFVLINLSKLVWKVSHIYNQRPNIKEIFYLYINVAGTVLMAREIEDLAIMDEQLEPVINSLIGGSLSNLVPGATAVTNLIINSIIQGSANAFLTLRVGIIAKKYSASITKVDKRWIRRSASIEAAGVLGQVVQKNSLSIVKAFVSASKKATIDKTIDKVKSGATKTGDFVKDIFKK